MNKICVLQFTGVPSGVHSPNLCEVFLGMTPDPLESCIKQFLKIHAYEYELFLKNAKDENGSSVHQSVILL